MIKAVILIGGPLKGTRFRPLSFDLPKLLFPVGGRPIVQHLIEACTQVSNLREILLIGFYQRDHSLHQFIESMTKKYDVNIKYLQEYTGLGTAGGIYHFRDQICRGGPEAFFIINGDVCGQFRMKDMLNKHRENKQMITMMVTEATRQQSLDYGCIVENQETNEVLHYVEKPSTFVSTIINCGVYVCDMRIFEHISIADKKKHDDIYDEETSENSFTNGGAANVGGERAETISLEQDILAPLANSKLLYVFHTKDWWSQIKTSGSAIYANRHYLELFRETHPELLFKNSADGPLIIGDVFVNPTAIVDPTATLGPNVSIGEGVRIGGGVRIKESIILRDAVVHDHSLIMHSIIGWKSVIGSWTRIEGTLSDPNPNKPFAKIENQNLFNNDGRLNPSVTVLGSNVQVPSEVIVLNSIVLPQKQLGRSYKNEIIL